MFIVNIHSKGKEAVANALCLTMSASYTLQTNGACEIVWLKDMFTDELAAAARVSKVELTDEVFKKWFACMKDLFGPDYVRNGILEVIKQKKLQGVNLLLVADADFTEEYAAAFKFWPLHQKQHMGVSVINGGPGLFVKEGEIQAGVQAIFGLMQRND